MSTVYNTRFKLTITFGANYHDTPRLPFIDIEICSFDIPDEFSVDQVDEDGNFPVIPQYIIDVFTYEDRNCTRIPILAKIERKATVKDDLILLKNLVL